MNLLQRIFTESNDLTKSIRSEMIDIVDTAPSYKLADIVINNETEINKILAKLLVLSLDMTSLAPESINSNHGDNNHRTIIDNNENNNFRQIRKQALLSFRKISKLGMTNENLFNKYKITDNGIKYNILSY